LLDDDWAETEERAACANFHGSQAGILIQYCAVPVGIRLLRTCKLEKLEDEPWTLRASAWVVDVGYHGPCLFGGPDAVLWLRASKRAAGSGEARRGNLVKGVKAGLLDCQCQGPGPR